MSRTAKSSTFNCLNQRPLASFRLFCFPWAGGGSTFYARWGEKANSNIEVVGIRIPGRESRQMEPFATSYAKLCEDLANEIYERYEDKPFAFFGHSMGLTLAYETAKVMVEKYAVGPVYMFLSGSYAPHSVEREKRLQTPESEAMHIKSDDDLLAMVGKQGGTPSQLLDNTAFMKEVFLPVFRADLNMAFRYYRPDAGKVPFQCGITFLDGDRDSDHHPAEIKELTNGNFQCIKLQGGHFYLQKEDNKDTILKHIAEVLTART